MAVRVAVADDHPTLLAGMEYLLSGLDDVVVMGLVTDSSALVELLTMAPCDVVVTDFSMPHGRYGDGLALLRFLQRRFPGIHLVVLTGMESHAVLRGILDTGVQALISKADDLSHLQAAIRAMHADAVYLSPEARRILDSVPTSDTVGMQGVRLTKRETEVLRLYAEGLTVSEIGIRNGRSSKTISAQKMTAMKKLGLTNDADIFRYARANGLVNVSQTSRQNAQEAGNASS